MSNNTLRHIYLKKKNWAVQNKETSSLSQYSLSVCFISELDRRTKPFLLLFMSVAVNNTMYPL